MYNLSVSVNILISKWEYTAAVDPNDPKTAEDWYFALWGYNGLAASNNPNTHADTLGTYYNPTSAPYPRSHYAYQEIVYGYALYPTTGTDGKPRWPSTKITHIDFSQICASCGDPGSSLVVSRPSPEHSGDCTGPDWAAQYVSQSFPLAGAGAVTLHEGETAAASLEMKNVGAKAWDGNTRLATTGPRDRASLFVGPDWLAPNRLAAVSGTVAPGASFKFQFTFKAPNQPGTYDEFFGMVQEGVAWFSDPGQGGPPDNQLEAKLIVLPALVEDAGSPAPGADAARPATHDGSVPAQADAALELADATSPAHDGSVATRADGGLPPDAHVGAGCGCSTTPELAAICLAPLVLALGRRRRLFTQLSS